MKFTDGYWMMRDGLTVVHPMEVYEAEQSDRGVEILAPTKPIRDRADTLNLPAFNLSLSSPIEDVISVKIVHHAGVRKRGP